MTWEPPKTDEWVPPSSDEIVGVSNGNKDQSGPSNAGLYDLGQNVQGRVNAVFGPVVKASDTVARGASNVMFGTDAPVNAIQSGLGLINKAGESLGNAVSGGAGYTAQKTANLTGSRIPPETDYAAGVAGTAASMIPSLLLQKLIPALNKPSGPLPGSADSARRAIFGTKSSINQMGGDVSKATDVGAKMIDEGVITPFSSKETMLQRAKDLSKTSGATIGQIPKALDSIATNGVNTDLAAKEIQNTLMPKLSKGAFSGDVNALNQVIDTVKAAGPEATFEQAQAIKQKLQDLGRFPKGQNVSQIEADKINMFRRASGIFNRHMEEAISRESPKLSEAYQTAKSDYGPAAMAIKGLRGEALSESANVQPSLRTTLAAGEALGSGNYGRAAMLLGLGELLAKKGNQIAAYTLGKAIPNTALSPMTRQALISEYINRLSNQEAK